VKKIIQGGGKMKKVGKEVGKEDKRDEAV